MNITLVEAELHALQSSWTTLTTNQVKVTASARHVGPTLTDKVSLYVYGDMPGFNEIAFFYHSNIMKITELNRR